MFLQRQRQTICVLPQRLVALHYPHSGVGFVLLAKYDMVSTNIGRCPIFTNACMTLVQDAFSETIVLF